MNKITIASLNTRGIALNPLSLSLRYKAIANYFQASKVDIIQFQEVFTYFHLSQLKLLSKTHPYVQYQKTFIGPKGGLVTFSRYPLDKKRFLRYSTHYRPLGVSTFERKITRKGILIAFLKRYNIIFINTHLSPVLNSDWSKNSKYYKQLMSEISEFYAEVEKYRGDKIIVATGDFNIAKGSYLYKELVRARSLHDPFKSSSASTIIQPIFLPRTKDSQCLDYFFIFAPRIPRASVHRYETARKDGRPEKKSHPFASGEEVIFGKSNIFRVVNKKYIFTKKTKMQNNKKDYVSDHVGLQVSIML